ncbi:MAG: CHAT domain-containing protein [Cyanobacteria bacterium J06632_22]
MKRVFKQQWQRYSTKSYTTLSWGIVGFLLSVVLAMGSLVTPASAAAPNQTTVAEVMTHNPLETGRTLYEVGQYEAAIAQFQIAVTQFARQGSTADQIAALNLLSIAYQALAQWPAAAQAIEQSLTLLNQQPPLPQLHAQALNTQANLQLSLGQTEQALSTWEQAESYYTQANDTLGILGSQINQAEALQDLGYYRRARQRLETANQQLSGLPDSTVKVVGLRSLGKALHRIGDPRTSYGYLAQALDIAQRLEATPELSATYLSIGRLATDVESADIALAYFEKAMDTALDAQSRLQAQLAQFALYSETAQLREATQLGIALFDQLQQQTASRTTVYNIVNFAHSMTRLAVAPIPRIELTQLLAQAAQFARDLQDPRAEAHTLRQLGQLYIETQQWDDAYQLTDMSLKVARATRSADVIAQSARQLGQLLKQQQKTEDAITVYSEAVSALQSLRGDLVAINQDVQFSYREQVEPVYREFVSLLLDIKTPTALGQARDVLEALQVAELDNFFREACLDIQANQIDEIDPTATIAYSIILPDRIATIYSKAGQPLQEFETPVAGETARQTLRYFLTQLHPSADKSERLQISQQIYDWIVRPAEDHGLLTVEQPLVFVLDGLLRNIPVAALYDGQHYLIEKYPVALSPGLQLMQARSLDSQSIQALVGGISEQRGAFSALPAVKTEVETISDLVPSAKLLNANFTKDAIAARLQSNDVDVVHFATHGQFSSDFSQTYFLTWDGVINIRELSELLQQRANNRRKAIELLTLSACETATGDDRATLGLAGLAVRSGARATIATLWPIKDDVAAQLMTTFYDALSQANVGKAAALRQAQLKLLQETDFDDPFFWSAYVLIGNWT